MLIKDFYTIHSFNKSKNSLFTEIHLNPEHEVYKGHFPQQAVVPGVIQLQIIKELFEKDLSVNLMIKEVIMAKYLNMITPEENPVLEITIENRLNETGDYLINAVISKDDIIFTKLKAKLSKSAM